MPGIADFNRANRGYRPASQAWAPSVVPIDPLAFLRNRVALDYNFVQGANAATLYDRDARVGPHDGSITNATWEGANDRLGFDGTAFVDTGEARVGETGLFAGPSETFTLLLVARTSGVGALVARSGSSNAATTFYMYVGLTDIRFFVRGQNTTGFTEATLGSWALYGVRWDGTTMHYRLNDGDLETVPVGTADENAVTQRIILGAASNGAGNPLVGAIAYAAVLDSAITNAEWDEAATLMRIAMLKRGYDFLSFDADGLEPFDEFAATRLEYQT